MKSHLYQILQQTGVRSPCQWQALCWSTAGINRWCSKQEEESASRALTTQKAAGICIKKKKKICAVQHLSTAHSLSLWRSTLPRTTYDLFFRGLKESIGFHLHDKAPAGTAQQLHHTGHSLQPHRSRLNNRSAKDTRRCNTSHSISLHCTDRIVPERQPLLNCQNKELILLTQHRICGAQLDSFVLHSLTFARLWHWSSTVAPRGLLPTLVTYQQSKGICLLRQKSFILHNLDQILSDNNNHVFWLPHPWKFPHPVLHFIPTWRPT